MSYWKKVLLSCMAITSSRTCIPTLGVKDNRDLRMIIKLILPWLERKCETTWWTKAYQYKDQISSMLWLQHRLFKTHKCTHIVNSNRCTKYMRPQDNSTIFSSSQATTSLLQQTKLSTKVPLSFPLTRMRMNRTFKRSCRCNNNKCSSRYSKAISTSSIMWWSKEEHHLLPSRCLRMIQGPCICSSSRDSSNKTTFRSLNIRTPTAAETPLNRWIYNSFPLDISNKPNTFQTTRSCKLHQAWKNRNAFWIKRCKI